MKFLPPTIAAVVVFRRRLFVFMPAVICLLLAGIASAVTTGPGIPAKPVKGFVSDETGRLEKSPVFNIVARIRMDLLYQQRAALYIAITAHPPEAETGFGQERSWAQGVFETWQLPEDGILLTVNAAAPTAHILMGERWKPEHRLQADTILSSTVLPALAEGHLLEGVLNATEGLDDLVRGRPLPSRMKWWADPSFYGWAGGFLLLGIVANLLLRYRKSPVLVWLPWIGAAVFLTEKTLYRRRAGRIPGRSAMGGDAAGDISGTDISFDGGGDGGGL